MGRVMVKTSYSLFFVISLLLLAGCSSGPSLDMGAVSSDRGADWYVSGSEAERGDSVVYRSPNDRRQYRHLTLENGLSVLLVSDPSTDKAAASLSVNIGSFDNPADREGLAHFLEHMLFLGTDKYPEPGEYQAFISEHGGVFNAYTSLEETNYFFDIDAEHLVPALDRFARFFVAPLFNAEYVDRERHAVESEYRLKIKDDARREWDVLRELANPRHPFSLFSVGNLDTLSDRDGDAVRADLVDFYQRHYSANQMNLVVLGEQSLDELQQSVEARFADVPNRDLVLEEEEIPLFDRPMPFKVSVVPEKDMRQLSVNFPLPSVERYWSGKPVEYLGHLVGHEGENSLLSELKRLGLADGLSAGLAFDSRRGALFSITVNLTEAGLASSEAVTRAVFDWLALIRDQGVESWRYREVQRLSQINFRFAEKHDPSGYVLSLSSRMHGLPPEEALRGPYLYADFDRALISGIADKLVPDNAFLTLIARDVNTDRSSRYYQVPFGVEPLDPDQLAPGANHVADLELDLQLPEPNIFIPERLAIHRPVEPVEKPRQVADGDASVLWHYPDSRFETPKAYFEARILLPETGTLRNETLLDLYVQTVRERLSATTYPAQLAGLGFDLQRWDKGLNLTVNGYSDKQPVLVSRILAELTVRDIDPVRFERVKNSLLRQWRNSAREWPIRQVFAGVSPLLENTWLPEEKVGALEQLGINDLKAFISDVFGHGRARYYAGGNLALDAASSMASEVSQALGIAGAGAGEDRIYHRVNRFTCTENLPVFELYVDHNDSVALLYFQGREDSLRERALFAVLEKMVEAPFYSDLRTDKQLGYVVGSAPAPVQRVPGMMFYVQSPTVDSDGLKKEVNRFLADYRAMVAGLEPDALERFKAAVLATVEEKPKNLMELAARHLESLNLGFEDFDFRQAFAQAIRALTVADIQTGYDRLLLGQQGGFWLLSSADEGIRGLDRAKRDACLGEAFKYPL